MEKRLLSIQAARGIAALLVVFYHAGRMIALPQYTGYIPLSGFFNFGHAGVDFFFVLSGFIIYFVHHKDIGRADRLQRYAWRRATRIYPIYWIVTVLVFVASMAHPERPDIAHIAKSLLLFPESAEPIVGVAWTLNHEILFYLMFLTLIVQRRLGILLFALWAAVIASWPLGLLPNNFAFEFLASPYNMEFFMGMGAAYLVLNSRVPSPRLLALLGTCAFFAVGMMENAGIIPARTNLLSETLFGASAATTVLGLAAAEIAGKLTASKSASFLGEASYSIYLIHVAIIGWTAHVLQLAGVIKAIPGWAAFFFVAASALTVALLLYEFVEKQALTWLNDFGRSHIYGPLRQREVRA